ncbi:integrase arm-type DNA-binding domain-containing protein [Psychromonas sp.]|uniref:integrase arm-type DNA-binding domain-containing protein n=1 Tax=Psychromonas sp. TaxID=1884585 RepID=UPI003569EE35
MAIKPLSPIQVEQAKSSDKVQTLADGGGLQLRIKPNGSRPWQLRYKKPFTKKYTVMGLGKYPEVSLADARDLRYSAKKLLAKGIDPIDDKKARELALMETHSNTLKLIAEKWFDVKKSHISSGYAKDIWGSLTRHIFPSVGGYPISQLTAQKVIQVLRPLEANGKYDTIKRICQRINEIMTYAVNTGIIVVNPLAGIGNAFRTVKTTNNPALEGSELPELMNALDMASIRSTTRCMIEWQLHTMTRPNETASARWEDIDLENMLWVIPANSIER